MIKQSISLFVAVSVSIYIAYKLPVILFSEDSSVYEAFNENLQRGFLGGFALPPFLQSSSQSPYVKQVHVIPAVASSNKFYPTLSSRMEALQARSRELPFSRDQLVEAMWHTSAWKREERIAALFIGTYNGLNDGRMYVRFNPLKIESLMPGDTLDIPLELEGNTYQMTLESVTEHENGSVVWQGVLKNYSTEYGVTFTRRDNNTYGSIHTPYDSYRLEVYDDLGWIASEWSLFTGDSVGLNESM